MPTPRLYPDPWPIHIIKTCRDHHTTHLEKRAGLPPALRDEWEEVGRVAQARRTRIDFVEETTKTTA